jgi:hypothetical protein
MNVAQRRGKGPEVKNQTILVTDETNYGVSICDHDPNPIANAVVHNSNANEYVPNVRSTCNNCNTANHAYSASSSSASASASASVLASNSITKHQGPTTMMSGISSNSNNNISVAAGTTTMPVTVVAAKVRRRYCGTGPFDYMWLNLDCCGLICAIITYLLHFYALYTVVFILIPPWMNTDIHSVDSTGQLQNATTALLKDVSTQVTRQMIAQQQQQNHHPTTTSMIHSVSWIGYLHRLLFTIIAMLAIVSHYKAMTTDPGSVPPDAQPTTTSLQNAETKSSANNSNSSTSVTTDALANTTDVDNNSKATQHASAIQNYLLEPPPSPPKNTVKRICRRCKSYKPYRAHHCSICQRCIIKMES